MIRIILGLALLMVMISAGAVSLLKQTTDTLEARKGQLSSLILKDQAAIKVLKAEMAYLSRPERLERLSHRFLVLVPGENSQMVASADELRMRENMLLASLPVDDFRLLLPRPKPQLKNTPVMQENVMQAKVRPVQQAQKIAFGQKKSFYERMIAKLERP